MLPLLASLFISDAVADIAPGPFYREDCTVDKKEQEGTTCDTCTNSVNSESQDSAGEAPGACDNKFEGTGYTYVCKTNGVSYWSEVWCDGEAKEGCSHMGPIGAGSMMLLVGFLYAGRREFNTGSPD